MDTVEILKAEPVLSPPERKTHQPRRGWAESRTDADQIDTRMNMLSPEQSSSGGDVSWRSVFGKLCESFS